MASVLRPSRRTGATKKRSQNKRTARVGSAAAPPVKQKSRAKKIPTKRRALKEKPVSPQVNAVEAALAAFAHEVRTPLTGILAISSLLATSDLNDREKRWVETIKTSAEHLAALATLFVDAAKCGQSGLQARAEFFDLRVFCQAMGDSLAGRAAARGLQARVGISDDLPGFVVGDHVRMRAALENLIDNAVKFTTEGEVTFDVTAKLGASDAITVAFVIGDSGIGLSLAEIRRLFRPFSQANVSIASRFGGAGLGLSSVKQLARAMGGDVTAAQRPQGGTLFTLKVKLKAAATRAALNDQQIPSLPGLRSLRILSVEDNPFGRVVLNAILTELGHRTEFIEDGESAAKRIQKEPFDIVLMDMVLPGISGIEAIKRIRALAPPLGQIAIAGLSGRAEDEVSARMAGADAFLIKPVSPRALASVLAEATARVPPGT
jgi:signal transduction histidine kinase/CheY-like chemotaxis protein